MIDDWWFLAMVRVVESQKVEKFRQKIRVVSCVVSCRVSCRVLSCPVSSEKLCIKAALRHLTAILDRKMQCNSIFADFSYNIFSVLLQKLFSLWLLVHESISIIIHELPYCYAMITYEIHCTKLRVSYNWKPVIIPSFRKESEKPRQKYGIFIVLRFVYYNNNRWRSVVYRILNQRRLFWQTKEKFRNMKRSWD